MVVLKEESEAMNEDQILELVDHGYTRAMIKFLEKMKEEVALRIWIIDNSSSMLNNDGHQLMESPNDSKNKNIIPSSRWAELRDSVNHHIELARITGTPTNFRLLNNPGARVGPQRFGICENGENNKLQEAHLATDVMSKVNPDGTTPLTAHIYDIYNEIKANEPYLRSVGKIVAVVIATDGLPTDSNGAEGPHEHLNFINALKKLEGLPVWISIRVCTSDDNVTDFYNHLDKEIELPIEVIDDFVNEAKVIHELNPWLTYGIPLHRLREIGTHIRLLDFLDEHEYTLSEVRDFMKFFFGTKEIVDAAPDPNLDLSGYMKYIESKVFSKEEECWSPIKRKVQPWINIKKLDRRASLKKPFKAIKNSFRTSRSGLWTKKKISAQ